MPLPALNFAKPAPLDVAELDRINFLLPDCCRFPGLSTSRTHKGVSLLVAACVAAKAVFMLPQGEGESLDQRLARIYHTQFCINGGDRSKPIDPIDFANKREAIFTIATFEIDKERRENKIVLRTGPEAPPPPSAPCPCGNTQANSLVLRKRSKAPAPS